MLPSPRGGRSTVSVTIYPVWDKAPFRGHLVIGTGFCIHVSSTVVLNKVSVGVSSVYAGGGRLEE